MNEKIPDHPIAKIDRPKLEESKVSHALENESYRMDGITNDHGSWDRSAPDGTDREPVGAGNPGKRPGFSTDH